MSPTPTNNAAESGGTKLVLIALGLAILAVVLTNVYVENIRKQAVGASFNAYILKVPVRPGDRVRMQDLTIHRIPNDFADAFQGMGAVDNPGLTVRIARNEVYQQGGEAGEFLTYRMFSPPQGQDIDRRITEGMRLTDLQINSRRVPGPLRVGMFVDIEAAFQTDQGIRVLTVMEHVKVIALGMQSAYDFAEEGGGRAARNFRTMTVEVTPEQATQLDLIERFTLGDFSLHLRNPRDELRPKIPAGGINPAVIQLVQRRAQTAPPTR